MEKHITKSEQETEALGRALAETLSPGDVIAFRGGLGAGKTAFTRGLGAGLGVTDGVASPTFAIASVYRGGRLLLVHFDMYRVTGQEALEGTGYYDYIADGAPVVYAIEWSENIEDALPRGAITVAIARVDDHTREITIDRGESA